MNTKINTLVLSIGILMLVSCRQKGRQTFHPPLSSNSPESSSVLSKESPKVEPTKKSEPPSKKLTNHYCPANFSYDPTLKRCHPPLQPYFPPKPLPYVYNAIDNYAYNSTGKASTQNYGRNFRDLVASSGDLKVTGSVALAGAIGSIVYKGLQFLVAGGHGDAFSFISHDWKKPGHPQECNNPTEGGYRDRPGQFPFTGPSASWIEKWWQEPDYTGFSTVSSLVDFVPPGEESEDSGHGICKNTRKVAGRGFWLSKWVKTGWSSNGVSLPHTLSMNFLYQVPEYAENMDIGAVAYLSRYFTREFFFNYQNNALIEKMRGSALRFQPEHSQKFGYLNHAAPNYCLNNLSNANVARVFTSADQRLAVGLLVLPIFNANQEAKPLAYTATHWDSYTPNYPHKFRILAFQQFFENVPPGTSLSSNIMLFFGSITDVKRDIKVFCEKSGRCSKGQELTNPLLDPRVFDVQAFRKFNPDLVRHGIASHDALTTYWLSYGARAGRRAHSSFVVTDYLRENPKTLAHAKTEKGTMDYCLAIRHYLQNKSN